MLPNAYAQTELTGGDTHGIGALACVFLMLASVQAVAQDAARGAADLSARVLIVPRREATLSTEISARIREMPYQEGQRFKQGRRLIVLDCEVQRANLKKAQAELWSTEQVVVSNEKLKKFEGISELDAAMAEADVRKAAADVAVMAAQVSACVVTAPFGGRVVERVADTHEYVNPGDPVLRILDDSRLKAEILISASDLGAIKIGGHVSLHIEETGNVYDAEIVGVGARVDTASQVVEIYADIKGQHPELLPGMSGTVRFDRYQ